MKVLVDFDYNHYSMIPLETIGQKVLEIGVNEEKILKSEIGDRIRESDYLGIDTNPKFQVLNVVVADILEYEIREKYDTILMMEVLEHLHLRDWNNVIQKLKDSLKENGYFIISVPYRESLSRYIIRIQQFDYHEYYYQYHTVFHINKTVLRHYFPGCKFKTVIDVTFNIDKRSHAWSLGRFIKRVVFKRGFYPLRYNIIAIWKNESEKR